MGTLAAEIEDRLALLSDPNTKWVQHFPGPGTSCLVLDVVVLYTDERMISPRLSRFLSDLVVGYARVRDGAPDDWFPDGYGNYDWVTNESIAPSDAADFNDHFAKDRQDVIDFLNVALDIAEDERL